MVEMLLAELQKFKAEKRTGAMVALSFSKRLTQPIQERVQPGYEYSGRENPTRGQNYKVSHSEAHRWVTLIMIGEVLDKGCPKAYCLKRPTIEEKIVSFWCPTPLPEGQQGKAVDPPARLALPTMDVGSFLSNSSIGSESDDFVEVSGPAAGAGFTTKKWHPTRKVATWRASLSGTKRKAEESAHEANSAELAMGELSPMEWPLACPRLIEGAAAKAKEEAVAPLEVAPGDGAKAGVVEDPADPNAAPRVIASRSELPEEKVPREEAVATK
ncbi:hypothetical protein C2845_PM13G09060 [Panicum miliaceum]|uniref:Uncharacterized protein n=1 Tax=Panicum miliaceum TaxID=4540 RepID=A0A3L6RKR0_PANMI|nr:hypothetical protein C2845_PM13G09060 [Panicum miliaceum]